MPSHWCLHSAFNNRGTRHSLSLASREQTLTEPSHEVIYLAQQGNHDALNQLVYSQQHYVYSIAMSVLKNPDDAADLTQEAFIRLFRTLPQYNGDSRFTTWLYRLVVNLGRDELRRRGRQVPLAFTDDNEEYDPLTLVADEDRWTDPVMAYETDALRDQVRHALDQLDEQYRLVLTLYYFDDVKYTDIAAILHMPLNTVKSHIRRGKERLAQLLTDEQPPATQTIHATPTPPPTQPPSGLVPMCFCSSASHIGVRP